MNNSNSSNSNATDEIPPELLKDFKKVVIDMTKDILTTFPEFTETLDDNLKRILSNTDTEDEISLKAVFIHCKEIYPDKFFDILYQNEIVFTNEKASAEFLPGIDFKIIWKDDISDKTRETIWKYLQLVLFTIITGVSNGDSFGDTAKLFETINQDEFKSKLEETIAQMQNVFDSQKEEKNNNNGNGNDNDKNEESNDNSPPNINLDDLPNPSDIHEHVNKMMEGKLGKLAREIAEETASDLNINTENAESVSDVFQGLLKNPTKLMGLISNVGGKLDEKLKSGDMNESELLQEASEIMKQMKNMPGMEKMMSKMGMNMGGMGGMGGMGKGRKMNTGAMQAKLDKNIKAASQKDRMRANLAARQAVKAAQEEQKLIESNEETIMTEERPNQTPVNLVFSTGEQVERSTKKPNKKKKKKNTNK
jgi:hypothetical protein